MEEVKKIKCPNCGFSNVLGAKKCIKCGASIKTYKSCPKCAKKNDLDATKCIKCGFNFNKRRRSLICNVVISLLVVLLLLALTKLSFANPVKWINKGLKVLAVVVIIVMIYNVFNFHNEDIVSLDATSDMKFSNEKLTKLRKISKYVLMGGVILVGIYIIYLILSK